MASSSKVGRYRTGMANLLAKLVAPVTSTDGVLYVSIPFTMVVHRCCCGCGNEVVTPLDPTDWQMPIDGKSVSLSPSIGNWSLACQSHYWIHRSHVGGLDAIRYLRSRQAMPSTVSGKRSHRQ